MAIPADLLVNVMDPGIAQAGTGVRGGCRHFAGDTYVTTPRQGAAIGRGSEKWRGEPRAHTEALADSRAGRPDTGATIQETRFSARK